MRVAPLLVAAALTVPIALPDAGAASPISDARQLTFEGERAGEGYFSADGSKMIFQSERTEGNPFFQMYLFDLETGDVERLSTGVGKTTCGWLHPDGERALFATTQFDPKANWRPVPRARTGGIPGTTIRPTRSSRPTWRKAATRS